MGIDLKLLIVDGPATDPGCAGYVDAILEMPRVNGLRDAVLSLSQVPFHRVRYENPLTDTGAMDVTCDALGKPICCYRAADMASAIRDLVSITNGLRPYYLFLNALPVNTPVLAYWH